MKNKKARITLEFAVGLVISILIFIAIFGIISNFFRLSDASKDSFDNLINKIKKVGKPNVNPGTLDSIVLRMDEQTYIVGFSKEDDSFLLGNILQKTAGYIDLKEKSLTKTDFKDCEKGKACICLCRELEYKDSKNEIKCKDDSTYCENFDEGNYNEDNKYKGVNFMENFFISRHTDFLLGEDYVKKSKPSHLQQFRTVYIEKYKGYEGEVIAVCEDKDFNEGSCVNEEYKAKGKAINGLNELANFIELCDDKKNPQDGPLCGCGIFDYSRYVSEKYKIKLINNDGNLQIALKEGSEGIDKLIDSETKFCQYTISCSLSSDPEARGEEWNKNEDCYIYHDEPNLIKELVLEQNLEENYNFCKDSREECNEKFITFVKDQKGRICILRYDESSIGVVGSFDDKSYKNINSINVSSLKEISIDGGRNLWRSFPGCSSD
jgi:hypothetical protein